MYRYVRTQQPEFSTHALTMYYNGRPFYPIIQHAAIDQDRPVGDRKTFREHYHDLYHVVLYTKSQGAYSKNGRFYPAVPGTVVFISPGQLHDFVTRRGGSVYSEITFSFESEQHQCLDLTFRELLSLYTGVQIKLLEESAQLDSHQIKEFMILLVQLSDFLQGHSPLTKYHTQRTLAQLFECIITNCCQIEQKGAMVGNKALSVKQYIDTHYAEPISIEELAEMAHISKGYLFRSFKKTFGVSPVAYQQNLRVEAAKTLLRSSAMRCNEIARRVGYDNIYFFHRVFKKIAGIPPKQFRDSYFNEQ